MENQAKYSLDYPQIFLAARQEDEDYFELMTAWFTEVTKAMDAGGTLDFFGKMYEETWKGKGKASALGQFYTPESTCSLMAEMISDDGRGTYNDCTCGSGRTLLAAFAKADRSKFLWFDAGDIDYISCKMCALNFMVHGMLGEVKQQDALTLETPSVIYHVNEVRYPFPTNMYSIRREYPSKTERKVLKPSEEEKPKKRKEPIQLSLFE